MSRSERRAYTRGMKSVYVNTLGQIVSEPVSAPEPMVRPKVKLLTLAVRWALYVQYGAVPGQRLLS